MKISRFIWIIIFLFFNNQTMAIVKQDCQTLLCVRNNINLIDNQIVKLIGLRLTYVKKAGEIKKGKQPIHDQARENQILQKVANLAEKIGYPSSIAVEIYKTILLQANIYEKQNHKDLNNATIK